MMRFLYQILFRRWLISENEDRVVAVKGWRTMLVDNKYGSRRRITPMFWFDRVKK